MKNEQLVITPKQIIKSSDNKVVMHEWEHPIMKAKADYICQNGGDILELGFGMGISATYIQQHNINSHTICEIHPQVIKKLHKWKQNKTNVIVLEGDWFSNVNQMGKYDGILFDTFEDATNAVQFPNLLNKICKPNCLITWWNNLSEEYDEFNFKTTKFKKIEVNPPQNTYFNNNIYYMPKYTYSI